MKVAFRALSVACLLVIGGCGASINVNQTPEWKASLTAKTQVEMMTRQRDAVRKYDSDYDQIDVAMWDASIAAAEQYDRKKISWNQYQAMVSDAIAVRTARKKSVEAAEDAAYYAHRAATRGYYCQRSGSGSYCY